MAAVWTCPACGRFFANPNQSHACGRHALEPHFEGRSAKVRAIYDAFLAIRRDWVVGHLVLARRVERSAVHPGRELLARNHLHAFRLDTPDQVATLAGHAREAHAVGRQEHLR
ncbi:MAG: hypothetical protein QOD42_1317 [Sphingomonadales bacterium]|nr:hypothetical protein [Sphingomonadales bacterium]